MNKTENAYQTLEAEGLSVRSGEVGESFARPGRGLVLSRVRENFSRLRKSTEAKP